MSSLAQTFQFMYQHNRISIGGLQQAVTDGAITQEEFNEIVGEE